MAVTLKQIAARTGFSVPTVHQILSGAYAGFAESTRKKVIEAAAEMGYRPNITARSLVTQRSFLIGILFYAPNFPFVSAFTRGAQASILAHGCSPLFLTHDTAEEEAENLQSVLDRRVDGIIVNAAVGEHGAANAGRFAGLGGQGTPVVEVFGRFIEGVPRVAFDYRAAARAMTERLLADGHRRVAVLLRDGFHEADAGLVGGRYWNSTEFFQGYRSALQGSGVPATVCRYPVDDSGDGQNAHYLGAGRAASELFRDPAAAPTAVLCFTDDAADALVRAYAALDGGFGRPLTVAALRDVRPSMTDRVRVISFPFPTEQAGAAAADAVFDLIAGRPAADTALPPAAGKPVDPVASAPSARPPRAGQSLR